MMQRRSALSVLVILCMVLAMLPQTVMAADGSAPYIWGWSAGTAFLVGETAEFSISISGSYWFQWFMDTGSGWTPITTQTKDTSATVYTISETTLAMNGYKFKVVVTNAYGSAEKEWELKVETLPIVTAENITISGATGTGGVFKIGDTMTFRWDNSVTGDNKSGDNGGLKGAMMDISRFYSLSIGAREADGVWTATYVVTKGSKDATGLEFAVKASREKASTTTWSTLSIAMDNQAPVVTDARISISGASGNNGVFKIGDTVTARWDNTADGDNNQDIVNVTVDFSRFGGGTAVAATNNSGIWTAEYTIVAGAISAANRDVAVTVTDDAGNTTTMADTTNATVDNVAPTVTISSTVSGATSSVPIPVAITFSEEVTGFTADNITVTNGTVSSFTPENATIYTVGITPSAKGTITVDVASGVVTDTAGNANASASAPLSIEYVPASMTPTATVTSVAKTSVTQPSVVFELTNTPPYSDGQTWKVYTSATGDTLASDITATNNGNTLTLTSSDVVNGIAAATYYVSVTETDKAESARVALTVGMPVYAVTYKPGANGTGSQTSDDKVHDTALTLKGAIFTRAGYTQTGWATVDGGAKAYELGGSYTDNAAIDLYPVWEPDTYTVAYKPGTDGTGDATSVTKTHDITLTLQGAIFTREGYTQTGWAISDGGAKAYELNGGYTGNAAIDLYPVWTPVTYAVSYKPGLDGTGSETSDEKVHDITLTLKGAIFTREGYTQTGWATSDGGVQVYELGGGFTDNAATNLYPVWTPIYTIVYKPGANGTGSKTSDDKVHDVVLTLKGAIFTRAGYTQTGWATVDGEAKAYDLGASYMGNAAIDLYPVWTPVTYDVTYNPGTNGSGDAAADTKTYGVALTLQGAIFTRAGYTHTGWSTVDGGAKIYELGGNYTDNAAIDLYPVWTPVTYDVTYKPGTNGSGDAASDTKTHDVTLTLRDAVFTREGYTQTGWATVDGGEKAYDLGASYTGNASIDLYPVWAPISYTITLNVNGGHPLTPAQLATDPFGKLSSLPVPNRSGNYSFSGWFTAVSGGDAATTETVFTTDATIYARWTYIDDSSSDDTPDTGSGTPNQNGGGSTPDGNTGGNTGGNTNPPATPVTPVIPFDETKPEAPKADKVELKLPILVSTDYSIDLADILNAKDAEGNDVSVKGMEVTSSDPSIADFADGKLVFKKPGTVTIIVKNGDEEVFISVQCIDITPQEDKTFVDTANHWAEGAIHSVAALGIVAGFPDSSFRPEDTITVEDTLTFVARTLLHLDDLSTAIRPTADFQISRDSYAYYAISDVVARLGEEHTRALFGDAIDVKHELTRGEFAQIMYNLTQGKLLRVGDLDPAQFTDIAGSQYQEALEYCIEFGLIRGTSETTVEPDRKITRAELMAILERFITACVNH